MKRLYIALLLLAMVIVICVFSHLYLHRQLDYMLMHLDEIESLAHAGDIARAVQLAEDFTATYRQICDRISCYVAHGELRQSQETVDVLPMLLQQNHSDELWMELARLRSQLRHLQQVDDPLLHNIL